jgi:hypothetical protein
MTSKWDFYQCTVNAKPASIYLDLGLHGAAPDPKRPLLLIVWLDLRDPDPEHRMATDAEFDTLAAIEDRLADNFKSGYGCVYAGRITTDGRREFYFYTASVNQLEALALAALAPFPGYTVKAWSQPDPAWEQYLGVLYPRGSALRWMKDKGVVEALAKAGDTAAIGRAVSHFSYFASAAKRTAFTQSIENAGFRIGKLLDNRKAGDSQPFGVEYRLTQTPTLAVMSETTALLTRLSEKNAGQYEGWQCAPVGPHARPWWRVWRFWRFWRF